MEEKELPLILVTNDDGISAPGLRNLVNVMKTIGRVVVVAPAGPQSGMGHAITIAHPLRLEKVDLHGEVEAYQCSGTPVDCVKLAVDIVLNGKPDLLVSGINHGSNSSINVIYSGTMSAAVEGGIEGIPSIGFSLCDFSYNADFNHVLPYVKKIALQSLQMDLPKHTILNVNFPASSSESIRGIRICRQANAKYQEKFDRRQDPSGRDYYWLTGSFLNKDHGEDTDEWALNNNYVSVVPVQFDLTNYSSLPLLSEWDLSSIS